MDGLKADDPIFPLWEEGWCGHEWETPEGKSPIAGGSIADGRRGERESLPSPNVAGLLRGGHVEVARNGIPQYSPRRPFRSLQRHTPQSSRSQGTTPRRRGDKRWRTIHAALVGNQTACLSVPSTNFAEELNFFPMVEKSGPIFPLRTSFQCNRGGLATATLGKRWKGQASDVGFL